MRLIFRPARPGPVSDCAVFRKELFRVFFVFAAAAAAADGFDTASEAGDGFPQRSFRVAARRGGGDMYNALAAAVSSSKTPAC
jgi:hypothetical protein